MSFVIDLQRAVKEFNLTIISDGSDQRTSNFIYIYMFIFHTQNQYQLQETYSGSSHTNIFSTNASICPQKLWKTHLPRF